MSFWNDIDLCSFILNIAFVVCDLAKVEPNSVRALGSTAVFIMWLKFFYFLRLFETTAPIVRMIF